MTLKKETIGIYATGGTFDKEYNELDGSLFFKDTHIYEMLKRGRCTVAVSIRTLMLMDSADMTDEERNIILANCKHTTKKRIVITHGTDTMIDTAHLLGNHITEKTIVLTGALIPYAFGSSDGFFNLGNALAYVQVLPPGVYIVMNGQYFAPDAVKKNFSTGYFEKIT